METTPAEFMVTAAARMIQDGEVVFVGMRLPLLAFLLAKETHAPRAVGLFENGVIRDVPAEDSIVTMGDPPNLTGALKCTDMLEVMGLLQRGKVHVGIIGAAQIDRFGNLNTTWIGPEEERRVRLPGSGGAADIASLAQRLVVLMAHERRRLVERVDYVTSPGYGIGGDWRYRMGLVRGGPEAVVTTCGVFRFDPLSKEAVLAGVRPGVGLEEIQEKTAWGLKIASDVGEMAVPGRRELEIIRKYDPQGFWTGR